MVLKKGSIVDLVAPSSGFSKGEYDKSVQYIRGLGLNPRVSEYSEIVDESSLYAHTDDVRYHHLANAIMASDSDAIWCLQGGHGSARLFEKLVTLKPSKEKVFIGFSDVTAIAMLFGHLWGWKSVYAPNLVQIVQGKVSELSVKSTEALIFEGETRLDGLVSYNESACQGKSQSLVLQGGCLALVQALIGTDYQPKADDCTMLLLEDDRFESPQRVDRMLMQIMRSGMLDSVGAVLLGNFLEQPEHEVTEIEKKHLDDVLTEFGLWLDQKKIPLVRHNKVGHAYHMVPLILGKESQLVISGDKIELIN